MIARDVVVLLIAVALIAVTACAGDDGAEGAATLPSSSIAGATSTSTTTPPTATAAEVLDTVGAPTSSPPGAVSSFVLELVDTTRTTPFGSDDQARSGRMLPTHVHLPASSESAPLIVLAHGMDGHPDKFTELATYWAEAGYVVTAPAFPMSNRDAPDLDVGAAIADIPGQAGDISFVIDEMIRRNDASGRLVGRIDPERIGVFGLSLGSITMWTTLLGDCCNESRVDALIQSDGAPLASTDALAPIPPNQLADLPLPVMLAHSDADTTLPYADVHVEFEALPGETVFLTLHGFAHATVAENTETPADDAFREATTIFWDRHLGDQPEAPFPATVELDGVTTLEPPRPR